MASHAGQDSFISWTDALCGFFLAGVVGGRLFDWRFVSWQGSGSPYFARINMPCPPIEGVVVVFAVDVSNFTSNGERTWSCAHFSRYLQRCGAIVLERFVIATLNTLCAPRVRFPSSPPSLVREVGNGREEEEGQGSVRLEKRSPHGISRQSATTPTAGCPQRRFSGRFGKSALRSRCRQPRRRHGGRW